MVVVVVVAVATNGLSRDGVEDGVCGVDGAMNDFL